MAQIKATNADKVFKINRFLGVNENPDGDTNLRMGEASTMTNFKITNDGSLQKRPGTQNVANLLFDYSVSVAAETTTVLTETISTTATFECYPGIDVTDGGLLTLTGTPETVNYANLAAHVNWYYRDVNGVIYKLGTCVYDSGLVGGVQQYRWNKWSCNTFTSYYYILSWVWFSTNATTPVTGASGYTFNSSTGAYATTGDSVTASNGTVYGNLAKVDVTPSGSTWYKGSVRGPYSSTSYSKGSTSYGYVYGPTAAYPSNGKKLDGGIYYWYDGKIASTSYTWKFNAVTIIPDIGPAPVRGIWAGNVGGTEVICAACNGRFWVLSETDGVWVKESVGFIDTDTTVHFFGFDAKLFILDGTSYLVWDGETLITVTGYRPLIAVAVPPAGGGTLLERVNMLNGLRRMRFSPDGTAIIFQLPEKSLASIDYVKNLTTGNNYTITTDYTVATATGTVTFTTAPTSGTNTVEIGYSASATLRSGIEAMTLSELFNGANDNRIFLYGDGSNKAYYSDIDYDGQARADYFPDLNIVHIGEANTPITSMLRHHNRLLAFKEDSAYSIAYGTITLVTGTVTAGFYVATINKGLGSAGYAQAQLIENKVRTLDGRSIYEWSATDSSGNVTADQRNANPISEKVDTTIKQIDLEKAITFFDKIGREYYIVENGTAIVQNTDNKAWYIYRDFPAVCMIVYKDELYFGTADGFIRHVSRDYRHDIGNPIQCYWESGSMDFGASSKRKFSDSVWIVLKPEDSASVAVTVVTDKLTNYEDVTVIADYTAEVSTGFFSYLDLNYEHFSYNINSNPQTQRRKIKVKNFTWYKLIFSTADSDTTATVLRAEIKARETGVVK